MHIFQPEHAIFCRIYENVITRIHFRQIPLRYLDLRMDMVPLGAVTGHPRNTLHTETTWIHGLQTTLRMDIPLIPLGVGNGHPQNILQAEAT